MMSFSERYQIANALYDIDVAQGKTAAMDVVRAMLTQVRTLKAESPETILAWIGEVS